MARFELFYPLKPSVITQGFGLNPQVYSRFGVNGHSGLDMRAAHGTPVFAAHDGVVVYTGMDSSEGVGVVIRTNKEFEYSGGVAYFKSIYWHLINNIPIKAGQKVKAGEIIGYADNTGFSTGSHLHFAIKPQAKGENDWSWYNLAQNNGYHGAIDPTTYFNGYYAEEAQQIISGLSEQIRLLMMQIVLVLKDRIYNFLAK